MPLLASSPSNVDLAFQIVSNTPRISFSVLTVVSLRLPYRLALCAPRGR